MSHIKSLGSIWIIAATYMLATVEKSTYKVFLDKSGHIFVVDDEKDAPSDASYVASVNKADTGADPRFLASRLAYQATRHCVQP